MGREGRRAAEEGASRLLVEEAQDDLEEAEEAFCHQEVEGATCRPVGVVGMGALQTNGGGKGVPIQ